MRRLLINLADFLEDGAKKLRGAAGRISSEGIITLADCESQNWENVRPCFVLSTGRSGTLLLNRLLSTASNAIAVHQPKPELIRASRKAYEEISSSPEIFQEVFKCAREELILEAAQKKSVFIETNNRITFFAPVIKKVFPGAVFIHLVRHPGHFVRSGIRRKWYSGRHDHDIGRIVPVQGELKVRWDKLTIIEKIAWLWNETNQFIENFKEKLPDEDLLFLKAEDLFHDPEVAGQIFRFLHLEGFRLKVARKILQKPVNVQKKGDFPRFEDWSPEEKEKMRAFTPLAEKYGYII